MPESVAFIRPATPADLEHFNTFSQESGPGITSLPHNEVFLEQQLVQSERSFFSTLHSKKKNTYLFCLEIEGRVIGASGLASRIGIEEPFFAFHKRIETHHSPTLKFGHAIPVLHFIEARKKPTEIGTLYLQKQFRGKGFGQLLSYARFLFISLFQKRFASTVIAELRGVNHEGVSPFWEALGRHFFDLDFSQADHLRITNPEAIKDLFPRHPIYTVLLPQDAQEVIGKPHPRTLPAKNMLVEQGFQISEYLDIFDAGPHLYAPTKEICVINQSHRATLRELRSELRGPCRAIISNTRIDFRACVSSILIEKDRVTLPIHTGRALSVDVGEEIIYYIIP